MLCGVVSCCTCVASCCVVLYSCCLVLSRVVSCCVVLLLVSFSRLDPMVL